MSWIKRNLVFVVFSAIAVLGLGLSGWYLYSEWSANNESTAKLEQAYQDLTTVTTMSPNPGNETVDNIKNARDAQILVRAETKKALKHFASIEPIPPGTNVSAADFSGALRRTIDELTRAASSASVTIQPRYDFSFAAEKPIMRFSAGSLEPLAAQLGDVRAICEVLFAARVNTLSSLKRTRVCEEDRGTGASLADYIETSPVTNDLAVLVPYEVTFYGFSGEVAAVLSGFANQPRGFIITGINIEPGTPGSAAADTMMTPNAPVISENYTPNPYAQRNPYGNPYAAPPAATQPTPASRPGGPTIVLDEKQLKVTMAISAVKFLAKQ
jgi:hypothetical protein